MRTFFLLFSVGFLVFLFVPIQGSDCAADELERGFRISRALSLGEIKYFESGSIEWDFTAPTGTAISIMTAVNSDRNNPPDNDSLDWEEVISGGSIPGISIGDNLANKYLWVKQSFYTNNETVTPFLHSLLVELYEKQFSPGEKIGDFGVTLREGGLPGETDFHGWAWGDDETAWISFNCENLGECDYSNYKVWMMDLVVVPGRPIVQTNPARKVLGRQSIDYAISGRLFGMGSYEEVDVWLEHGLNPENLTNETVRQSISEPRVFSEILTFSEANIGTRYYFRAMAENGEGVMEGGVMNFIISKAEGLITVRYGEKEQGIDIKEGGVIEITK